MDWKFELVAGPYGGTSEGPAWDGQAMLFTDIPNSRIMRFDPESGECSEYRAGTNETNGLMFDAEGRLYGCSGGGRCILRFDPDGTSTPLPHHLNGSRHNRPPSRLLHWLSGRQAQYNQASKELPEAASGIEKPVLGLE